MTASATSERPAPRLIIDDDTSVLEAVVQDLRRNYGQFYRIVRAASGGAALDICRQLKERDETVALFLSDQPLVVKLPYWVIRHDARF